MAKKITKIQKKPIKYKKVVKQEFYSSEESDVDLKLLCQDDEFDDLAADLLPSAVNKESSDICNICNDIGKGCEPWYRCITCSSWSHADCSGAGTAEDYVTSV